MKYHVTFRPLAQEDLFALHDYIAQEAGYATAGGYIDRIEAACLALGTFPERGQLRDDIYPGLRPIGFEKRATIAFMVKRREVVIVRIFYGGQDFETLLKNAAPEE